MPLCNRSHSQLPAPSRHVKPHPALTFRPRSGRTELPNGARSGALAWLLASWLLLLPAGRAAGAAPDHEWQTLETPHFAIHFHEGLEEVAQQAARGLERAHELLVPRLGEGPKRRTHVVVSDDTDAANGSATAWGRPTIFLLAEPPDDLSVLGDFDDYLYLLVAHEYVHVLHLGTVRGLPAFLNRILGDVWIPNGIQPRFVTEGYAVYLETVLTAGGRLRYSLFDMYLRADVLEDRILDLGQLSSGPARWPWGTAWYLYGGKLIEYLAATRGDEVLRRYSEEYGGNLIPWAMNVDLRRVAEIDWIALYEEWKEQIRRQYRDQAEAIRARGPITEPALRSRFGERTMGPRWSRDGSTLFYVEATADRRPWLRAIDRATGEDRAVAPLGAAGEIAPWREGVVLARQEVLGAYRVHGDLFAVDEEGERRLTTALRASEVDVSPDGATAVFVQRGRGRTRLARHDLRTGATEVLFEPDRGVQVFTPRFDPHGERIVFAQSRTTGGRDLWILHLATGARELLTDDGAIDLDPTFTPDGRSVVFASDAEGVFDLHRIDLETGARFRLTNVLTGAFQPDVSPDGSWIAWTTYTSRGFDVAASPLADLQPVPVPGGVAARPPTTAPAEGPTWPVRPYDPLETMAPQTWFPWLASDADGTVLGASLSGGDVVGRHTWSLVAGYGLGSREPHAGFGYAWNGLFPSLELAASTNWQRIPGLSSGRERVSAAALGLLFPWSSTRRSHGFHLGWQGTWYDPVHLPPQGTPGEGLASELQLAFSFGSAERPSEAISAEDGVAFSVGTRFGLPELASDFTYATLDLAGGAFLRLPWGRHHVLALLGRAGFGQGDLGNRRLYALGGPTLRDPILDLLYTGRLMGSSVLRGYEPSAFVGSNLLLGTVEYRFPIWNADAGAWTLPLYAGRLSGALFAEAGDAFDGVGTRRLHPAAGAELRWDVQAGLLAGTVRFGAARGFDVEEGGGDRLYLGVGAGF